MRAAWRLAISSWRGRAGRTALLIGAVLLSAALVTAVSNALASASSAIEARVASVVGDADVRVLSSRSGGMFGIELLDEVRGWEGVAGAGAARIEHLTANAASDVLAPDGDGAWTKAQESYRAPTMVTGLDAEGFAARSVPLVAGRLPVEPGEVVIDVLLAVRLSWYHTHVYLKERTGRAERAYGFARAGDADRYTETVEFPERVESAGAARELNERTGPRIGGTVRIGGLFRSDEFTIVGIAEQPPLGGRPQAFMTLAGLARISGETTDISEIGVTLREGEDPAAVAAVWRERLGDAYLVQESTKVTTDVAGHMRSSQLGFVLISTLAFLSASFIIMTGLSTDVTQRQRELAVLRCVGALRGQMAAAQVLVGLGIGLVGAVVGVPLGLAIAWAISVAFRDRLPAGLEVSPTFTVLAFFGTIIAGLLGAAWPAWRVARLSPLEGLSLRAVPVSRVGVRLVTVAALVGIATQAAIVTFITDSQWLFYTYATVGVPAMFGGYFLLGVPAVLIIGRFAGPWIGRRLGLGATLLPRAVRATPYRFGFTAGAMMTGLALMVSIWATGGSVLRDWLDQIAFPDAFVSGINLPPETKQRLDALGFVESTCAISLQPVETDAFGVRGMQKFKTTFVGFEPGPFFGMTRLEWIEGDVESATRALEAGGAVIVAKEFNVAKGLGVGDTFTCGHDGEEYTFTIAGVVDAPGLHIVSKFFNIGDEVVSQSLHAVFGSRGDMIRLFNNDSVQLVQIDLSDEIGDEEAIERVRTELAGLPVIDAGSGRLIKDEIVRFVKGLLAVFTAIAVVSMSVASCGVANIVIAGIHARRFEFGVLRAVGAQRGTLVRLILAEALVVALAASVIGTLMGLQGSWAATRIQRVVAGVELSTQPPWGAIGLGALVVVAMTLGAAAPAVWRLGRRQTRELLMGA